MSSRPWSFPIIYLIAFGLGLGSRVQMVGTDYLSYLIPGLVAMSAMNNSYTWVASNINLNRLYLKTFQVFVQAPIRSSSIMVGEVLAGMAKGLFASALIIVVGLLTSSRFSLSVLFGVTLLLTCFLFASLGVITGMLAKSHEDTATYSNFFIMPMAFFSGTFFPVDRNAGHHKNHHLYPAPYPRQHRHPQGSPGRYRNPFPPDPDRVRPRFFYLRIVSDQKIQRMRLFLLSGHGKRCNQDPSRQSPHLPCFGAPDPSSGSSQKDSWQPR